LSCSICQICVTKTNLKKHLNSILHNDNNKDDYSILYNLVPNLDIIEISYLDTSLNYQRCFSFLVINQNAFSCKKCSNYIVLTNKRMRVHLSDKHNIKNI